MLFILITIAWLAIATIIIGACRIAASADSIARARAAEEDGRLRQGMPAAGPSALPGLTLAEPVRDERLSVLAEGRTGRARGSAATARRRTPRVRSLAGHGPRRPADR